MTGKRPVSAGTGRPSSEGKQQPPTEIRRSQAMRSGKIVTLGDAVVGVVSERDLEGGATHTFR